MRDRSTQLNRGKGAVSVVATARRPASFSQRVIEVHVRAVSQLFDSLDPSPFRERDLDPNAEEYIVESVKELSPRTPCELMIHLDQATDLADEEAAIGGAIRVHFERRSGVLQRSFRQLIRRGFISLAIGLAFLGTVFGIAQLIGRLLGENGWSRLAREGLMIAGWVAMWRPLEIFLYDWWPILGLKRVYDRLSQVEVRVVHESAGRYIPGGTDENLKDLQRVLSGTRSAEPQPVFSDREINQALARWENEGGKLGTGAI
jgi:hypothetical protein